MAYPLRIESEEEIWHISTRTVRSRLWFINNKALEYLILAYLAKFAAEYRITIYSFILMGNHYHLIAKFPKLNKAAFMQSFNSRLARLVDLKVEIYKEGRLWARRYADQALVNDADIEHWFMYCALNPVISGVAKTLGEYESYNSFSDAVSGKVKEFKVFNRAKYLAERRWKKDIKKKDYIETYRLEYQRLAAYGELSPSEYRKSMWEKLEERRRVEIEKRVSEGKGFASKENRKNLRPGARPRFTKTTGEYDFTPTVLSLCKKSKREYLERRLVIVNKHHEASKRYRSGELDVEFPPGTYRPPAFCGPPEDFQQAA
ncbi:MAG: transposase [Bdellovibrionota bacterium]